MFSGAFPLVVDDKGRVAIPAGFRSRLSGLQDERVVVTRFKRRERPCLDVYPLSTWLKLGERLSAEKRFNERKATFESWYVSHAQEVPLDSQGRILVPPGLRDYARIARDVMVVGATDKFRVWDRDLFHQVDREDEHDIFEKDATVLNDIGL
jgi:MraZ protein